MIIILMLLKSKVKKNIPSKLKFLLIYFVLILVELSVILYIFIYLLKPFTVKLALWFFINPLTPTCFLW